MRTCCGRATPTPTDLAAIEAVPLAARGLPESTYALLARAATRWPDRTAITVLPEAARWREPLRRTFGELLADVHRCANLLYGLGVRRGDAVALMAPNCAELVTGTLAAQLAGIAAPLNGGLNRGHLAELLRRSGARVLLAAGPELSPATWGPPSTGWRGDLDVVLVLRPTGGGRPRPRRCHRQRGARRLPRRAGGRHGPGGFAGDVPGSADLAGLFHTGGTTGAPKLAAHTHANELADAWMVATRPLFQSASVGVRRAAAVPRQRAGGHPAGAAVQGPAGGVGRSARLPGPRRCSASSGGSSSTTGSG